MPLYHAITFQKGEEAAKLVKLLLAAFPDAARAKDSNGCLLLYTAASCQKGKHSLAVVTALLTAYPLGARQLDSQGNLPMDAAKANPYLSGACIRTLRLATKGKWRPS